jgi:hypothetical protein
MVRVGIQESISTVLLQDFTCEVELVRIPDEPEGDIEIETWIAPASLKVIRRQLPHLRGLQVVQALWAGVDFLGILRAAMCLNNRKSMCCIPAERGLERVDDRGESL